MRFRFKRRHLTVAALGLTTALITAACLPADGVSQTIALAGSDTTQDVMGAIATAENADAAYNTDPDTLRNILSQQFTPLTVNGDTDCATRVYHTPATPPEFLAPNGSSAGRDALKASVLAGDGCIDVARSSGPPRAIGSDLASFEYYAFALDAVGWSSGSTKAPINLTLAQLRSIYDCTFTNWNQVGGTAGAIERYYPQSGSGTRQFFQNEVLGFDPTTISGPGCPAPIITQENSGQLIAANGDLETAVVPYSMANWVAQANGAQPDQTAGQLLRQLNGQYLWKFVSGGLAANTAPGPVQESNVALNDPTPAYPGIRYVFNVIDNTHDRYAQAKRYLGATNQSGSAGSESPLCDDKRKSIIQTYGFGPLDRTVGPRNLGASTCRLFTP